MIKRLCENHGFDYVLETKQGLTHARLCAISQNKSDWLLFVDDDNILAPDFIRQLGRIIEERPNIGALSGQVRITKSDCNVYATRVCLSIGSWTKIAGETNSSTDALHLVERDWPSTKALQPSIFNTTRMGSAH